jgi:hypothetical protein
MSAWIDRAPRNGYWLLAGVALLAGCDLVSQTLLEDDFEPPVKNEAGIREISQKFGDAIQAEDYSAAYALTSASLQAKRSKEQFIAEARAQRQEYFGELKPTRCELEPFMPFDDEFADWESIPKDIRYQDLLGMCTITWYGEITVTDGQPPEPFETYLDIVVVNDGGTPRIAHIDWINEF